MDLKFLSMNRGERIGIIILLCVLAIIAVINLNLRNSTTVDSQVVKHANEIAKFKQELSTINSASDTLENKPKRRKKQARNPHQSERRLLDDELSTFEGE